MKARHEPEPRAGARAGFTLIELLVVMWIIALLVGLLLPAVQGARESARRLRCAESLRQMTLAAHGFESQRGGFPPMVNTPAFPDPGPDGLAHFFSTQVALLPFLDQAPLYGSMNLIPQFGQPHDLEGPNRTAALTVVETFLCPSDPRRRQGPWAANSYRGNIGVDPTRRDAHGVLHHIEEGAFVIMKPVLPLGDFRDGLSNTLAFSEKPIGTGQAGAGAFSPSRDWFASSAGAVTGADWYAACARLTEPQPNVDAGLTWMLAGAIYTHFYASAPPNSPVPDCGTMNNMGMGVFAARSYHPGGVNAAMADGSARWFTASTNLQVWRALGTRAGGEAVAP